MLRHSLMSSCVVFTPNGTVGSTATRAPCDHARSAARAATWSHWIVSVAYGRWKLCASVAPQGSTAMSYGVASTVFQVVSARMYGRVIPLRLPPAIVGAIHIRKDLLRIDLDRGHAGRIVERDRVLPRAGQPDVDRNHPTLDATIGSRHREANRHWRESAIVDRDDKLAARRHRRSDRLIERPRLVPPGAPEPRQIAGAEQVEAVKEIKLRRVLVLPAQSIRAVRRKK